MRGAGGGRPRKPEGTTRHRNPPTRNQIVVYSDARVDPIPDPPVPLQGLQQAQWRDLWSQPLATLWANPADLMTLVRLVALQTSADAMLDKGLLAEIRQLEDRFLLSPYARAQQRIVILDPPEEEAPVQRESVYQHLRVVGDTP